MGPGRKKLSAHLSENPSNRYCSFTFILFFSVVNLASWSFPRNPAPSLHLPCSFPRQLQLELPPPSWSFSRQMSEMSQVNMLPSQPNIGGGLAQIVCDKCQTLLTYAHLNGSASFECTYAPTKGRPSEIFLCSACRNPNASQMPEMAQTVCGGCRILLQHPASAVCVKCSVCGGITLVAIPGSGGPAGLSTATSQPTIIIENPGSSIGLGFEVREDDAERMRSSQISLSQDVL